MKIVFFLTLFVTSLVFAKTYTQVINKSGIYTIKNMTGTFQSKEKDFTITITLDKKKQVWHIVMSAKTTGWLAIGFDRTIVMKNSEIIFGYVSGTNQLLSHQYGTSWFTHKPIAKLVKNYKPILTLISTQETNGQTTIEFERPVKTHGKYYKNLNPKKIIDLLYAYGEKDLSVKKHKKHSRGIIKIQLPG